MRGDLLMDTRTPQGEDGYPPHLTDYLGEQAPAAISLRGNLDLWFRRTTLLLAVFCSSKAPGGVILQLHDLAQQWRMADVTVVSGFHSPAEQEALVVLLRGPQPVIVCPARSIVGMRLKPEYKEPLAAGRLLLVSPFEEKVRRITAETAMARNRFVAALADSVLIAHAHPRSKSEGLAREVKEWGKPLYTLDNPANAELLALGARAMGSPVR
jgi:predicted Rossmann fold nucleotide-binding protein DprA/Smf involved in DNA uptake